MMTKDSKGRFTTGTMPQEIKDKISNTMKGTIPANIKIFQEAAKKSNTGRKHTLETREKMSIAHQGEKCHLWKGGISKPYKKGYFTWQYKKWRTKVFERDDYTCQDCNARCGNGTAVYLTAHHIKSFAYYPNIRFDVDNGKTLCEPCHEKTDNYKGRAKKK